MATTVKGSAASGGQALTSPHSGWPLWGPTLPGKEPEAKVAQPILVGSGKEPRQQAARPSPLPSSSLVWRLGGGKHSLPSSSFPVSPFPTLPPCGFQAPSRTWGISSPRLPSLGSQASTDPNVVRQHECCGAGGGGGRGGGLHGARQTMGQIWEGPDPLPGPMARMQQWGPEEGFLSLKWGPGSERTAGWAGAWGAQGVTTPSRLCAPPGGHGTARQGLPGLHRYECLQASLGGPCLFWSPVTAPKHTLNGHSQTVSKVLGAQKTLDKQMDRDRRQSRSWGYWQLPLALQP